MSQLLAIITLVRQLAPVIAEAVQLIEQLFPEGGQGSKKLEMLYALLTAVADNAGIAQEQITSNQPLIEKVVGWLVAAYKGLGKFK